MDTTVWVIFLSLAILLAFGVMFLGFWVGWWYSHRSQGLSPYTGLPLRRATELPYYSAERVMRYLYDYHQYDNRIFKLSKAAFCRETGRIFTNCVTWLDIVKLDWTFLQKRYPGHWVSWGSLNDQQKDAIRAAHDSLEGFQIHKSSPEPAPRAISQEYIFEKPGPLYVDMQTKVLLGWKVVPDTDLEVLIVQKPIRQVK
jgi:hypothetical protein